MSYACEATTLAGFIQQLAVSYVANGYFFYVLGSIPDGKDPARTDAKLIDRYGIDCSKFTRARRKRAGLANIQYIRFRNRFILLATHGDHRFFQDEATQIRDVRREPLKVEGYAVSFRAGKVSVRIQRDEYELLKSHFLDLATHRSAAQRPTSSRPCRTSRTPRSADSCCVSGGRSTGHGRKRGSSRYRSLASPADGRS
jgi:hypothetical protein